MKSRANQLPGSLREIPSCVPMSREAGGPFEGGRREGSGLTLITVTEGQFRIYGGRRGVETVDAGEWALSSGYGEVMESDPDLLTKGFITSLSLDQFTLCGGDTTTVPPKCECLNCPERNEQFFIKGVCSGRLIQLAARLSAETITDSLAGTWMRQSQIAEFVAIVLQRPELQANPGCRTSNCARDLRLIEQVASYLEENLEEDHTLADLSRRFFLNECKLKQGFKEHYGATVFGYLRRKRMDRAWVLLEESESTVLEVSNAVGYSNSSHFARAFRDVHGMNPGEVRRVAVS